MKTCLRKLRMTSGEFYKWAPRLYLGALIAIIFTGLAYSLPALKVSSDGHFLVQDDGKNTPFIWTGGTAWFLIRRNPSEVDFYLDNRKQKGFNVIQIMAHQTDYAENEPFSQKNPVELNEAHWKYIDDIIAKASARNMYICMALMWGRDADVMLPDPANGNYQYGKLVGRRYANNNGVIFIGSGEYHKIVEPSDARTIPTTEQVNLLKRIGQGLEDGHGGKRLNTMHPNAGGAVHSTGSSSQHFYNEPWFDFCMFQTWGDMGYLVELVTSDYNRPTKKPTINGEPGYEDRHLTAAHPNDGVIDAWHCRVEAYWGIFSGAFGHTYGHQSIWNMGLISNQSTGTDWKTALNNDGAGDMVLFNNLIESRKPILLRVPSQNMITSNKGTMQGSAKREPGTLRIATRASDGSYAFVYTTRGENFTIDMSKISGSQAKAWWYNPRHGKCYDNNSNATESPFGTFNTSGTRDFNPPGATGQDRDWVLVLDDASKNFPVPGTITAETPSVATPVIKPQGRN